LTYNNRDYLLSSDNQDITLWESFRNGDREAFALLFRRHYEALFRYGSKFTVATPVLEDTIQELFMELWQAKSRTPVLSVRAYLLKALKYKLLKKYTQMLNTLPLREEEGGFEWSHETSLIARQDSVEKEKIVVEALNRLSNRQKEIIYLKYYQNLSYEEVSEIMNINYQAARNLLYQAIKSLKGWLPGSLEIFLLIFASCQHYNFHGFGTI
jgi:RNA polymerase sigma factor (sigma-70 family)